MSEHRRRHLRVIHRGAGLGIEQVFDDHLALGGGHVSQLHLAGHIADGKNAWHGSLHAFVDADGASSQLHAHFLQPKVFRVGHASDRDEQAIAGEGIAVIKCQSHAVTGGGAFHAAAEVQADALAFELPLQQVGEVRIHAGQKPILQFHERHLTAELRKDAGKLATDVAAAEDEKMLRGILKA